MALKYSYEEQIEKVIQNLKESLERALEVEKRVEEGEFQPGGLSYHSDAGTFRDTALIFLFENDVDKYFECIEKSARFCLLQLKHFDKEMGYNEITARRTAMGFMLSAALMTMDRDKILSYAGSVKDWPYGRCEEEWVVWLRKRDFLEDFEGWLRRRKELSREHVEKILAIRDEYYINDNITQFAEGLLLRDVILDDMGSAEKNLEHYKIAEGKKKWKPDMRDAHTSILEGDRAAFIEAIDDIVQYKSRTYKRNIDVPISFEGIYLCCLAMFRGMEIDIKEDLGKKARRFIPEECFSRALD